KLKWSPLHFIVFGAAALALFFYVGTALLAPHVPSVCHLLGGDITTFAGHRDCTFSQGMP
nr:hypothetical protein [Actinomycetota bacterium]